MINLLLGKPGSGKSYEAVVFHILPALAAGRKVITNLPLRLASVCAIDPDYRALLDIRTASYGPTRPAVPFSDIADYGDDWSGADGIGPLYVIDECHKSLPVGSTPRDVDEWYAEHRHEGADVLLITQSPGKLFKNIRELVDICYRVSNNRSLGTDKSYLRKVLNGVRGTVLGTQVRKYDKNNFQFYKSHTKRSADVVEAQAQDITPLWRRWPFLGAALVLPLGLFVILSNGSPWASDIEPAPPRPDVPSTPPKLPGTDDPPPPPPSAVAEPAVVEASPEKEKPSVYHPFQRVDMHLAGYVGNDRRQVYSIVATQNGQAVFRLTSDDLSHAGYELSPIGQCALAIHYGEFSRTIICDAPRVGVKVAGPSEF